MNLKYNIAETKYLFYWEVLYSHYLQIVRNNQGFRN